MHHSVTVGSYTFPLLCVVLSDFFILLGISSTGCSSLSAELFTSGLSSRMLSVQKVQRIIEALWWQLAACGNPPHAKCKGTAVTLFRHMVGKTDTSLQWKYNMNCKHSELQCLHILRSAFPTQIWIEAHLIYQRQKAITKGMPPFLLQTHSQNLRRNSDVKAINQKRVSKFFQKRFCSADLEWHSIDRSQRREGVRADGGWNQLPLNNRLECFGTRWQGVSYMDTTVFWVWFIQYF